MDVKYLDCTLRDGAHVNGGKFAEQHIKNITLGLAKANIDVVEIGFLKEVTYSKDITSFPYIDDAYRFLDEIGADKSVKYALMARSDQYDINRLPECNQRIKLIRIAFYYDYLKETIEYAKEVKAKGYEFTLNLINTPGSSMKDLMKVIDYANDIQPYALTMVDTYGVLEEQELSEIAREYNSHLDSKIRLGLHVHENKAMAFSLAKWFTENIGINRNIIVDGSLMGIGRAPGNLCTELMVDYLNQKYSKEIDLQEILDLIEKDILPIKNKYKWGYSPEYFISAKYRVHRSYAEYLKNKKFDLKSIDTLLSQIPPVKGLKYDESYLEQLIVQNEKRK